MVDSRGITRHQSAKHPSSQCLLIIVRRNFRTAAPTRPANILRRPACLGFNGNWFQICTDTDDANTGKTAHSLLITGGFRCYTQLFVNVCMRQ